MRRGLEEGELVVTQGAFKIDAELQIRAKPSMMTPEGGGGGGGGHGGMKMDKGAQMEKKPPPAASGPKLTAAARARMEAVLAAGKAAASVLDGGDPEQAKTALDELEQALRAVPADRLQGHAAMLWKECAMLLGNDVAEGRAEKMPPALRRLAETLREHLASMRSRLGLTAPQREDRPHPPVGAAFRKELGPMIRAYLALGEALAGDDGARAAAALQEARRALEAVDPAGLPEEHRRAWKTQRAALEKLLGGTGGTTDLGELRALFSALTGGYLAVLRRFGPPPGGPLYRIHCPMAFENRGTDWLQSDEEVRNPYYGAAMLRCGEVVEVIGGGEGGGEDE